MLDIADPTTLDIKAQMYDVSKIMANALCAREVSVVFLLSFYYFVAAL
jgi:hypothetical protein